MLSPLVCLTGPNRNNLVMAADALTPGATYKFKLTATYFGASGAAEVEVKMNRPPVCRAELHTGLWYSMLHMHTRAHVHESYA